MQSNNNCLECPIKYCATCNNNECLSCIEGYALESNKCIKCLVENAQTCESQLTVLRCQPSYWKNGDSCSPCR